MLKDSIKVDSLGGELQTTPLFWAAYHNHIYAVELLLRQGADASFTDESGFNAFLLSIQVSEVKLKSCHGYCVSGSEQAGDFCMRLSGSNGPQRCFPITAAYLVAKGTDINVRMRGAWTFLRLNIKVVCEVKC